MPAKKYLYKTENNQINEPTYRLLNELKDCLCGGKATWERQEDEVRFHCSKCAVATSFVTRNINARKQWNRGVEKRKMDKWLQSIQ